MTRRASRRVSTLVVAGAVAVTAIGSTAVGASDAPQIGEPGGEVSGNVSFWHAYSADSPEVQTLEDVLIPRFEEMHPDVDVESVPVPYDELHQKLVTAVAGGQLPDLVRSDIIWVPELADLGVLVPLDEAMPDFQALADQMFPGPLATNAWEDHYYGLPLDTNTRVLMYNAEALAAGGIEAPPATFDELRAAATALSGTDVFAFADNSTSGWNVLPWIWSAGGDITDADVTTATGYLNSPESVAGVQLLVDLYNEESIPDIILGDEGGTPTSEGLATGMYATILDGPWMFPIFADQFPDFELQTALVPAGPGGSISVVGGESIVMTEGSENKAAAAEFMRFLLSEEAQLAMAEVGQMPVLSSLGEQLTEIQDYYGVFVEQLATARPRTPTPAWPRIDEVLLTNIQQAVRGDVTVQEALDTAAAEIDGLLAEYGG